MIGPGNHVSNDDEGPLSLFGGQGSACDLDPLPTPDSYRWVPDDIPAGPQFNVAQFYTRLATDIHNGTSTLPTFGPAVLRQHMVKAIETAATNGFVQSYAFL